MNKWRMHLLLVLCLFLFPGKPAAQVVVSNVFTVTIEGVCLIGLNPFGTINMNLLASAAGETMAPNINSSTYLQMTSILPVNQTRRITVIVSSGDIPAGTLLKLTPASCTSGAGARGSVASTITLDKISNQTLIDVIGSCYTGTTPTSGYNLKYTWQVDPANYALLKAVAATNITITYTITNN